MPRATSFAPTIILRPQRISTLVKRNLQKFPEDFMFQLTKAGLEDWSFRAAGAAEIGQLSEWLVERALERDKPMHLLRLAIDLCGM